MPQVVNVYLKSAFGRVLCVEVARTDTDVFLVHLGDNVCVDLEVHPLEWSEVASGFRQDYKFDRLATPVMLHDAPYPADAAARRMIQSAVKREAQFNHGALSALADVLPPGDVHLFNSGDGFVGRFRDRDDALLIAGAIGAEPVLFSSAAEFKALVPEHRATVLAALDPDRKWPAKLSPNQLKEVFDMAKAAKKKAPKKVAKAQAKQKRSDGPVAKCRAIFERMKDKPSGEIIAACVAAGINKFTVSTQLGRWRKENGITPKRGGPRVAGKKASTKATPKKAAKKKAAPKAKKPAESMDDVRNNVAADSVQEQAA